MVIRKQTFRNQEEGKNRGPLTALKRMVTMQGELNMDHLKFHLISDSGKKMEKEWNTRIRRSQEEMKEVLWCFMCIKEEIGENYKVIYELWKEINPMTERINLIHSSSRGSLKVYAEFCSEEGKNVLSIKSVFRQFLVSKKHEIVTRICSDGCFVIIMYL